jgi:hypothetical protein
MGTDYIRHIGYGSWLGHDVLSRDDGYCSRDGVNRTQQFIGYMHHTEITRCSDCLPDDTLMDLYPDKYKFCPICGHSTLIDKNPEASWQKV